MPNHHKNKFVYAYKHFTWKVNDPQPRELTEELRSKFPEDYLLHLKKGERYNDRKVVAIPTKIKTQLCV